MNVAVSQKKKQKKINKNKPNNPFRSFFKPCCILREITTSFLGLLPAANLE